MFKILIVEDDATLRQLFSRVLTKNGYSVKGTGNGEEALSLLDGEYFDLIITDVMMPVMDGYQLISAIRQSGNSIPVLMVTAKTSLTI